MYRISLNRTSCWRAAAMLFAALMCAPIAASGQREMRGVPSAAPAQTQTAATAAAFHATPEEIGDALLAHQRYQEAIAEYKLAPKNSADVWNKMGIAYQLMFDTNDAEHCYRESLRLDSRNAHVINNLGTIYDSEKDYRKAEHLYRKALKIDPTSALIAKNLGTNLLARRKYTQGWELYKRALTLDPHVFDEHGASMVENAASLEERGAMNYYMAKGCVQAGLTDQAISYLRLAEEAGRGQQLCAAPQSAGVSATDGRAAVAISRAVVPAAVSIVYSHRASVVYTPANPSRSPWMPRVAQRISEEKS